MSFLAKSSAAPTTSPRYASFLSTKSGKTTKTFSFRNKKLVLPYSPGRPSSSSKKTLSLILKEKRRDDSLTRTCLQAELRETQPKSTRKFRLTRDRSDRSTPRGNPASASQRSLTAKEKRLIAYKPARSRSKGKAGQPVKSLLASFVTRAPAKTQEDYMKEHIEATLHSLRLIKQLPPVSLAELKAKRVRLPVIAGKTVIFDLDETLVHCCDDGELCDVRLPIRLPNGATIKAGINIRPYAVALLAEAQNMFEVIVFTASHQCYADAVLDYLDPNNQLIDYRLYRDSCVFVNGMLLKDLRILGNRKMENVVIVDNTVQCFGYQLNNGIPIISWTDDKQDKELFNLVAYLKSLAHVPDVRVVNKDTFKLGACLQSKALNNI